MNTKDANFKELGFDIWRRWDSCINFIPDKTGVYVFRLNGEFCRLKGKTDILYIGSSKSTLKKRLRFYNKPGPSQPTSQRLHKLLNMKEYKDVEIGWCIYKEDEVRNIENILLEQFNKEHHELPPWNRKR